MKLSYIAKETIDLPGTKLFKSWGRVVNSLTKAGYNNYEIEAIARDYYILKSAAGSSVGGAPFTALVKWLEFFGVTPRSTAVNNMIMKEFGKRDKLELNEAGVPCHRGTMPGNYHPNKTILVPVGTPLSCDPTSETYWSM